MTWAKTFKDVQEKQMRKLWNEFKQTWKLDKDHGTWIKVEPYQRGWIRTFGVRDDIKNRDDIVATLQVLKMVNNKVFSRNREFTHWDWKKKKEAPIVQQLRRLTPEEYAELSEKHKSYFVKRSLVDVRTFPFHKKEVVTRYEIKNEFWFVFVIEPNIIEYHWHPDPEWESHCSEIEHKISRENLWPKINKMLGSRTNYHHGWRPSAWMKNKYGQIMTEEGFEEE